MKVNLYTAAGGFVAEVEIPPFQTVPEVLVWGERYFVWRDETYVEAFTFWVPAA